jgi:hypothetical protein
LAFSGVPVTDATIVGGLHVAEAFDNLRYVKNFLVEYAKQSRKAAARGRSRRG